MSYIIITCLLKLLACKYIKNYQKMFDMTFPTPEKLNEYRDDDEQINQKFYRMKKLINKIKTYQKF